MNKVTIFVVALCTVLAPSAVHTQSDTDEPPELSEIPSASALGKLLETEIASILNSEDPEAGTYFDKIINFMNVPSFWVANIQEMIDERTAAFEPELRWDKRENHEKCREIFQKWVEKGQNLMSQYSHCHEGRFELAAEYQENILNGGSTFNKLRQIRDDDDLKKCMELDESDPEHESLCRKQLEFYMETIKATFRPMADAYVKSVHQLKELIDDVIMDYNCPRSEEVDSLQLKLYVSERDTIIQTAIHDGGCSAGRW